jgi:hypothetical protein
MNTQLYAGNQNYWIALTLLIPNKLQIKFDHLGESTTVTSEDLTVLILSLYYHI